MAKRKRPTWKQIKRQILNSPAAKEAAKECPICTPPEDAVVPDLIDGRDDASR